MSFLLGVLACTGEPTPVVPTGDPDALPGYDVRPVNDRCLAPAEPPASTTPLQAVPLFPTVELDDPLAALQAPGDPDHWFVIEQAGRVKRFDARDDAPVAEVVLDLRSTVDAGGELGLLGFAFHPAYADNGRVLLSYTRHGPVSVLAEVQVVDGVWGAPTELLTIDQPYSNHNGGDVAFGPDGYAYWAMGDGGSAGDPDDHAQNLQSLLGKILRIDVDTAPYAIPPDNPFVGRPDAAPAIYAYGFRNPFRMSFDPLTGALWTGDVGQDAFEEIDRVEAGGNYGWRVMEGDACYERNCESDGLVEPVFAYAHGAGRSVIGGGVYRGTAFPELAGTYLFSDFYHGRIMALRFDADGEPYQDVLAETSSAIAYFARDAGGEVVVVDRSGARLLRLEPAGEPSPSSFPDTLSATGCVDPDDPSSMAEGVIPFDVNHAFWSDGASKRRWFAVPDDATLTVDEDGDVQFPVGSVLLKELSRDGRRLETRLFMRHDSDTWAGYAYKWREDGTDADLVAGTDQVADWTIPGREACMQCHTEAAGRVLGVELGQLSRTVDYPTGRTSPQLRTLAEIGLIEPVSAAAWPALADEQADLTDRSRTYLHVNCSPCHRPEGPGRGELDLRRSTTLRDSGLCEAPTHGEVGGATAILSPGDADDSVLIRRLEDRGAHAMPPIATHVVDTEAVEVLGRWIDSLTRCR